MHFYECISTRTINANHSFAGAFLPGATLTLIANYKKASQHEVPQRPICHKRGGNSTAKQLLAPTLSRYHRIVPMALILLKIFDIDLLYKYVKKLEPTSRAYLSSLFAWESSEDTLFSERQWAGLGCKYAKQIHLTRQCGGNKHMSSEIQMNIGKAWQANVLQPFLRCLWWWYSPIIVMSAKQPLTL